MKLVQTPTNRTYLLVARTETLFSPGERRERTREWNHLRFTSLPLPNEPYLRNADLTRNRPLPYPDDSFDAIYSYHILEHLTPDDGLRMMREWRRVLKPGGICRVSTPDLAFFAEDYLRQLSRAEATPDIRQRHQHQWATYNLIDQAVRAKSGGKMAEALVKGEYDTDHLRYLNGDSLDFIVNGHEAPPTKSRFRATYLDGSPAPTGFLLRKLASSLAMRLIHRTFSPEKILQLIHEKNLWLYDRVSLRRLFEEAGFAYVTLADHRTSRIPEWKRYNFDQSPVGEHAREPSVFAEGTK